MSMRCTCGHDRDTHLHGPTYFACYSTTLPPCDCDRYQPDQREGGHPPVRASQRWTHPDDPLTPLDVEFYSLDYDQTSALMALWFGRKQLNNMSFLSRRSW